MSNTGSLSVRVFTTRAELPLEGASVIVFRSSMAGEQAGVLSVQTTDSSGEIEPVHVLIQNPKAFPYAVCSVWAHYPGYAALQMDGVQIFPGVNTIQNMELVPASNERRFILETPPQNL